MLKPQFSFFLLISVLFSQVVAASKTPWLVDSAGPGDFPLLQDNIAATIIASPDDFTVVSIAARDLARDIERVTGVCPPVRDTADGVRTPLIIAGTLGRSAIVDALVSSGQINASELEGAWESFILTTLEGYGPDGVPALVIAGSDRRGTAFGIYELSQAIGVSPWYWWADVTPERKNTIILKGGQRRFGPPSVKYRGIFLNDENWGLQPWAAKTFEPGLGDIGPKTYAKVCELLLRLKANTLWPAMHKCTRAFNLYPQNKFVANDYAIVMGSSHAEPMLRNNVTEWTDPPESYNYITNSAGVRAYWEERVAENGRFENIYTLGMRGIHDSHMVGPENNAQRIATLERIFRDQREILTRRINRKAEKIPQMFCVYKEVLDIYRDGLKVPEDVTIVWPDDNFGYILNHATPEEMNHSGGFGVYYHISYLGRPLSYLWLNTAPPELIWEEMSKAHAHGARTIWILNVGDIKPGEIGIELFMQMAWDAGRWNNRNIKNFLPEWASREFGAKHAQSIAALMREYYRLNFIRRPEQLQWWAPGEPPCASPYDKNEIDGRLAAFGKLRVAADNVTAEIPAEKQAAFEELVGYPVHGSALANLRYFHGEAGDAGAAMRHDFELRERTRRFNEDLAGGKWNHFMTTEPPPGKRGFMRLDHWKPHAFPPRQQESVENEIVLDATAFIKSTPNSGAAWEAIGDSGVAVFPTTQVLKWENPKNNAPCVDYKIGALPSGKTQVTVHFWPTHSIVANRGLRVAVGFDGGEPELMTCLIKYTSPEWAEGVLNNKVTASAEIIVSEGDAHTLNLYGVDAGVVVTKIVLSPAK